MLNLLLRIERLEERAEHLQAYLGCLRALNFARTDTEALTAQGLQLTAALTKLWGLTRRRLADLSEEQFGALTRDPALASACRRLCRERREGRIGLTPGEQAIAADLLVDSLQGWSRLAEDTLNAMSFAVVSPGEGVTEAPFARRFDYFWSSDPGMRQAAWNGLQAELEAQAPVLAACLNGLTGTRLTMLKRRGRSPIEDVAERNALRPSTVETMMSAVRAASGMLHEYLELKRRLLRLDRIGMQDRSAPIPGLSSPQAGSAIAVRLVRNAVGRVSPALAVSIDRMRSAGLIDAGVSPERQSGAFCWFAPLSGGPRVFINMDGSFASQTVFAHELGHAFHDEILTPLRPYQRQAPSSLAETASITAEHLFREGVLIDPASTLEMKAEVVLAELDSAVNYLLRLPRDFEFEQSAYEARRVGRLTEGRLCALQGEAHRAWFADKMGDDSLAWAGSPLLYSSYTDFFNFSYTFGFLLASAIATEFKLQGPQFQPTYEAFLALTGSHSAEDAALQTFGFDIGQPAFWRAALARTERRLNELRTMAPFIEALD